MSVADTDLSDVPPGEAFDAWRLPVLARAAFGALAPRAQLTHLAAWSLLAPTSHNSVPQRYRLQVASRTIEVFLDRKYVLTASDVVGRQAAVSVGCALESLVVAARAYGLRAEVELSALPIEQTKPLTPGEPRHVKLADVQLVPDPSAPEDLGRTDLDTMRRRKVVRAEFDESVKLTSEQAAELEAGVKATYPGLALHLLTDAPTLLFLGKFQELADSTVINREDFARELGDWLLPDETPGGLGMRGREFGLAPEAARRMHAGLKRELVLLPDEMTGFAKVGNLGMRSSSAVAVITVERDDLAHRIAAGRAYFALALLGQRHGFWTAMHAGITEVEAPNLALRGRLRTLRRPTVVCRLGRPLHAEDGQRAHSARPPLETVLLGDNPD